MRIIYWIATGLLALQMLFSAYMYFFQHDAIVKAFTSFNYPSYVIYPLAVLKLSGIAVILIKFLWKLLISIME